MFYFAFVSDFHFKYIFSIYLFIYYQLAFIYYSSFIYLVDCHLPLYGLLSNLRNQTYKEVKKKKRKRKTWSILHRDISLIQQILLITLCNYKGIILNHMPYT